MGACGSKLTPEQREQRARSKALERRMSVDNMSEEQKIKLLLLGAGESGKSTIFKQMRILYGDEMKDDERKRVAKLVLEKPICCLRSALEDFTWKCIRRHREDFERAANDGREREVLETSSRLHIVSATSPAWALSGSDGSNTKRARALKPIS